MKSPRLGRGLSALLGDAPAPAPAVGEALRTLPIEMLEPGPFQPRGAVEPSGLQELAESMREHGVLQPILVREKPGQSGHYQIIGGERRWRAAQLVPLHEVPVVIRDLGDREAMAAGLVENLQRQDLNALEEAEGYRRLLEEFGLTQDKLGQAVGKSRSHVANTLRLLALPDRVRELLRDGALTAGHARALLTAPDGDDDDGDKGTGFLWDQAIRAGLTVRNYGFSDASIYDADAAGGQERVARLRGRRADAEGGRIG